MYSLEITRSSTYLGYLVENQAHYTKKIWEGMYNWDVTVINHLENNQKGYLSFLTLACFIANIASPRIKKSVFLTSISFGAGLLNLTHRIENQTTWLINVTIVHLLFGQTLFERTVLAGISGVLIGNDFFSLPEDGKAKTLDRRILEILEQVPNSFKTWSAYILEKTNLTPYEDNKKWYLLFSLDFITGIAFSSHVFSLKSPFFSSIATSNLPLLSTFVFTYLSHVTPRELEEDDFEKVEEPFNKKLIELTFWLTITALVHTFVKKGSLKTFVTSTLTGTLGAKYAIERKRIIPLNISECYLMIRSGQQIQLFDKLWR